MPTLKTKTLNYGAMVDREYQVGPEPGTRSKKITHICIVKKLDLDGVTIAKGIAEFEEFDDTHIGAKFTTEYEYGQYGDSDTRHLAIEGWRPMTQEEKDLYQQQCVEHEKAQALFAANQLQRLRKEHPEWLKDELKETDDGT